MASIYISVILLCRVVQAIFSKRSSNEIKNIHMLVGYTSFSKFISALLGILLILFMQTGFKADLPTVLIAGFSGIMLFLSSFFSVYALKSGTVSLNSMFGTAGMIIPVIAGALFFNKPVSLMQMLGLGLFFLSAWLLIGSSKRIYTNFSIKTLLLLMGSLVSNGCTMLAQQMFTQYVPNGDVSVFSFLSFAIVALPGGIIYFAMSRHNAKTEEKPEKMPKILYVCAIFLAAAVFVINQLATMCTALISPVILFTFINGGGTIISTVVAAIMYRERLSTRSVLGLLLGIASLVVIKMFELQ